LFVLVFNDWKDRSAQNLFEHSAVDILAGLHAEQAHNGWCNVDVPHVDGCSPSSKAGR